MVALLTRWPSRRISSKSSSVPKTSGLRSTLSITGLAQVNGARGETETLDKMERRIEFDHRYIREWSLWMDCKILIKTALVVFRQENAY